MSDLGLVESQTRLKYLHKIIRTGTDSPFKTDFGILNTIRPAAEETK